MIDLSVGVIGAVALAAGAVVFALATSIAAKLGGDEVSGWLPVWSFRLLESAVRVMPEEHRDRYREEWRAELAAFRDRRLSGLAFAWRLRRRARSVNAALAESDGLGNVFDPEPATTHQPSLDAETIAEIVRRVVERTRPVNQLSFKEILEEMRSMLQDVKVESDPGDLARNYVGDISEMRREARQWPELPAMRDPSERPAVKAHPKADLHAAPRHVPPADWSEDGDADWSGLPDEVGAVRRRSRGRRESTVRARIRRTVREWSRMEIRL